MCVYEDAVCVCTHMMCVYEDARVCELVPQALLPPDAPFLKEE